MYFGGIWGGQLQRWTSGAYKPGDVYPPADQPAISAKIARLGSDMVSFAETPKDVVLLDENGKPVTAGDNGRRFFEAAWVHKYNGTYDFWYSTGDTHFIMYATGTSPYGPFTIKGKILEPVSAGRTTTRSSSSRGSGISSTTTRRRQAARRTCATSR